jgi:hypothetical protein
MSVLKQAGSERERTYSNLSLLLEAISRWQRHSKKMLALDLHPTQQFAFGHAI